MSIIIHDLPEKEALGLASMWLHTNNRLQMRFHGLNRKKDQAFHFSFPLLIQDRRVFLLFTFFLIALYPIKP